MSSFAYLRQLDVSTVKIDGQFIAGYIEDPLAREMVGAIARFARLAGKRTVAEGVESDVVLEHLRRAGVDYAQGYVHGQPVIVIETV